jgi:protease I
MGDRLKGVRVGFVMANEGVEQVELTSPWETVKGEGGQPVLVAPKPGRVQAMQHLDKGDTFPVDKPVQEVSVDDFDALVLPGGVANPDQLRMDKGAVDLVRACLDRGIPTAVICHGPWTVVEADRVRGRTLTSWPSLQTDIRNAGGTWVDEQVFVCTSGPGPLITSRKPDDLPAFDAKLVELFSGASQRQRRAS